MGSTTKLAAITPGESCRVSVIEKVALYHIVPLIINIARIVDMVVSAQCSTPNRIP